MNLIRHTCPRGHGSDGSGPKWHAPPRSESAAQKKSFRPHRRDYNEVPQATQKKSRPSPSNCVTTLIFGSYLVLVDPFQEYEIGEKEKEEEGKKRERKRKEKGKKKEKEGKEEGGKDKLRLGRIHGKRGRF